MITIVTGFRGIGKTSFLLKLINYLKNRGDRVAGILTPPVYNQDNEKIGFDAFKVEDEEQWELGRTDNSLEGPSYGPFTFSHRGFLRANRLLEECMNTDGFTFFLDEIGPLELLNHKGFYPILPLLNTLPHTQHGYIVIRPELIEQFITDIIPDQKYEILKITAENRDNLITNAREPSSGPDN